MNSLDSQNNGTFLSEKEMEELREYSHSNHIAFGCDQEKTQMYLVFRPDRIRTFEEMLERINFVSENFVKKELGRSSQIKRTPRGHYLYIGEKNDN